MPIDHRAARTRQPTRQCYTMRTAAPPPQPTKAGERVFPDRNLKEQPVPTLVPTVPTLCQRCADTLATT
eukprot:7391162-Prymnesium_polylepis.3